MRKTTEHVIAAALTLVTLAGCGSDDIGADAGTGKCRPDFTATIGGVQTRAFDSSWEAGDEIGISGGSYTNVCYLTKDGDGRFTVKTPGDEIYFQDESEVTFTAYYPWNSLAEGVTAISADTWAQAHQKSFDFLWAQASGKKASPQVAFTFAHRMTKVVLSVKPGNGVGYDEVKAAVLSLEGFRHKGTFSIADGSTSVDDVTTAMWEFAGNENAHYNAPAIFNDAEGTVTFPLIFFPQEFDAPLPFFAELAGGQTLKAEIDFTAANREKDGTDAKNEWVEGRQYNLTVTLHKTGITLDNCSIMPWEEVNGGNIDAEQ